mmetsp:Transcript_2858/g.8675  ORF Transcript_2858/g.8675 Transcript_2858/m.8675 type:complete len:276 (+) Transcript_2858:209-1036(+)
MKRFASTCSWRPTLSSGCRGARARTAQGSRPACTTRSGWPSSSACCCCSGPRWSSSAPTGGSYSRTWWTLPCACSREPTPLRAGAPRCCAGCWRWPAPSRRRWRQAACWSTSRSARATHACAPIKLRWRRRCAPRRCIVPVPPCRPRCTRICPWRCAWRTPWQSCSSQASTRTRWMPRRRRRPARRHSPTRTRAPTAGAATRTVSPTRGVPRPSGSRRCARCRPRWRASWRQSSCFAPATSAARQWAWRRSPRCAHRWPPWCARSRQVPACGRTA